MHAASADATVAQNAKIGDGQHRDFGIMHPFEHDAQRVSRTIAARIELPTAYHFKPG